MALPELFGAYLLHDILAEGSTSTVYLAQTMGDFPRLCAIKKIDRSTASLPGFKEGFRQSASLLVRLIHGNLTGVLEVGMTDDVPFIVMEQVDGVSLDHFINDAQAIGPLPAEAALHIGLEISEALSYLARRRHELRLSHHAEFAWSLQFMLSFDGVVKLIDPGSWGALRFALAEHLPSDALHHARLNAPGYLIPEVILNHPLSAQSDVFALGVHLWQLLSGKALLSAMPDYVDALRASRFKAPLIKRKDIPGSIVRLIAQMLDIDPKKRPDSLDEMRPLLVSALRKAAPAYGSNDLAALLKTRCNARVAELAELTKAASNRTRTTQDHAPRAEHTQTFGSSDTTLVDIKPPVELKPGDPIPGTRYRVVRSLGRGGSAEVFCAQHIDLDRQVAIKILDHELGQHAHAIAQFRLEARACSRIGHPNIVDVIDFGELDDGRFFFAMELLQGQSLAEVLNQERKLSPDRALPIFRQIAKALAAAHQHHVIHRDIKPDNIMLVTRDGRDDFVKILDFGVMAFAGGEGQKDGFSAGTPGYMPPEQLEGATPTPQMDIYALGTALYETLSGTVPYSGRSIVDYAAQQSMGPAMKLSSLPGMKAIDPQIERLIHRALEHDPNFRQPSAADFEADLIVAQKAAHITTPWDDLPTPENLIETDRASLALYRTAGDHPHVDDPPDEHDRGEPTMIVSYQEPPSRTKTIAISLIVISSLLILSIIAWKMIDAEKEKRRQQALQAAKNKQAEKERLENAITKLFDKAEKASAIGHYTEPSGQSAYDYLQQAKTKNENHPQIKTLNTRFSNELIGYATRLTKDNYNEAALILYQEALLFTPNDKTLLAAISDIHKKLETKPDAQHIRAEQNKTRPKAKLAQIAHLIVAINQAVAKGHLIKPKNASALTYLAKLKTLDPSGKQTLNVQNQMVEKLKTQADTLWNQNQKERAKPIYHHIAQLSPSDKEAKTRSQDQTPTEVAPPPVKIAKTKQPKTKNTRLEKIQTDAQRAKGKLTQAKLYFNAGKLKEAKAAYQEARSAQPNNVEALKGLCNVALRQGNYVEAVERARHAVKVAPRNVGALMLLGDAFSRIGKKTRAEAAWKAALQLSPNHLGLKKRLDQSS